MRDKNPSGATETARRGAAASLPRVINGAGRTVFVWDLATRLFHWLVVALVPAAYLTWRLNWMDWHAWVGDALLALLLFRLLWGFFGSQTARFSCFLASPRAAAHHLAHAFHSEPDAQAGHNPAGGWMVMLLLALLLGQTLTGLYVDNDVANEGPLTELSPTRIANMVTALHDKLLWDALLAAAALHVLGDPRLRLGEPAQPAGSDDLRPKKGCRNGYRRHTWPLRHARFFCLPRQLPRPPRSQTTCEGT